MSLNITVIPYSSARQRIDDFFSNDTFKISYFDYLASVVLENDPDALFSFNEHSIGMKGTSSKSYFYVSKDNNEYLIYYTNQTRTTFDEDLNYLETQCVNSINAIINRSPVSPDYIEKEQFIKKTITELKSFIEYAYPAVLKVTKNALNASIAISYCAVAILGGKVLRQKIVLQNNEYDYYYLFQSFDGKCHDLLNYLYRLKREGNPYVKRFKAIDSEQNRNIYDSLLNEIITSLPKDESIHVETYVSQDKSTETQVNPFRFDSEGYDINGYDKDGYDRYGYDEYGYDKDGYDLDGYDRYGLNVDGFDECGWDKDGFDKDGYDILGFDKDGYDKEGYDANGFGRDGFNKEGYDEDGFGRDGFNKDDYDREGFDIDGYNKNGYDRYNRNLAIKNSKIDHFGIKYRSVRYLSLDFSRLNMIDMIWALNLVLDNHEFDVLYIEVAFKEGPSEQVKRRLLEYSNKRVKRIGIETNEENWSIRYYLNN